LNGFGALQITARKMVLRIMNTNLKVPGVLYGVPAENIHCNGLKFGRLAITPGKKNTKI
jgi:hypothetical protein